jgi:uncharacterized RDD family membrane protein YckC
MEEQDTIFSDIEDPEVEGTYFQRLFTGLIDTVINLVPIILIYKFLPREISINLIGKSSLNTYIFIILLIALYRLVFLLIFDKTLGMMLCRLKYLNAKRRPLTIKEKFIAVFAISTAKIRYYKSS